MPSIRTAIAFTLGLLSGCSAEESSSSSDKSESSVETYVGSLAPSATSTTMADTDPVIAVTASEREVAVYICGVSESTLERTQWLRGERAVDGSFELSAGNWHVVGSANADGIEGTAQFGDESEQSFNVSSAPSDTLAGLYNVVDDGCRTGVIVQQMDPETQPIINGTWCNANGDREQVIPLMPLAIDDGTLQVRVELEDESRDLFVTRFTL